MGMWYAAMVCANTAKRKNSGNSSEGFAGSGPAQSEQRNPLDVGAHSLVGGSCNRPKAQNCKKFKSPGEILQTSWHLNLPVTELFC